MFKDEIKRLRKQKGLTQDELADALGVSRSAVSMWELGSREPNFEAAETIADFFNVSLDSLISQKQIDDYVNELRKNQLKKVLFGTTNISDEKLNEVLEYARFVKERKGFD